MVNQSKQTPYRKKILSIVLSASVLTTSVVSLGTVIHTPAMEVDAVEIGTDYGLMDNIQDGTILHCFDWTYADIQAELPNIAEAGFTAVQTSPAQPSAGPDAATGSWWWLYQPTSYYIGTNYLGTKTELESLCTEAHKYGIKIVVDMVSNHLAKTSSKIDPSYLSEDQYWHTDDDTRTKRQKTTQNSLSGLYDIDTENTVIQGLVHDYVQELKAAGVDGIRWDTTKHIALPSEGSDFWPAVIDTTMYNYGEILGDPGGDTDAQNVSLMKEYAKYLSVTDDVYGRQLTNWFNGGSETPGYANWARRGLESNQVVYWGESHDTYSNGPTQYGVTTSMSQNVIDRSYAIGACRAGATALYYSRPSETEKDSILAGVKGSTHFTVPEVAAVNHFHNAMFGQQEYFKIDSTYNCAVVSREKGAVIAAKSGSNQTVSVVNGGGTTQPGTYIDEITGNEWTVTSTTISGTIGSTGIAVLFNEEMLSGSVSAVPASNTSFTDETLTVTLKANKITNASYQTSEGQSGTYVDGDTITIGSSTSYGNTITVTLSGTNSNNEAVRETYSYYKKDPNEAVKIYFDNSSYNWSSVYAYVYADSTTNNGTWPGQKMTIGTSGYYEYELPENLASSCYVIFTQDNSTKTNRYPANGEPGMECSGQSMIFGANHSWNVYIPTESSISASLGSGTVFFDDTQALTLYADNMQDASYQTSEGASASFQNGDTITIGGQTEYGSSVTVTLTGTTQKGDSITAEYTYPKQKPVTVYFVNKDNWSTINAYVYDENSSQKMSEWPGTAMTKVSGSLYKIEIRQSYIDSARIIFNDKVSSSTYNRYPQGDSNTPGYEIKGISKILDGSAPTWEDYESSVRYTNLSLEGDIGLHYYVKAADYLVEQGITAELSGPNTSKSIQLKLSDKLSNNNATNGLYKLTYSLDATQMKQDVTLTLKDSSGNTLPLNNAEGKAYTDQKAIYSIQDYIDTVKQDTTSSENLQNLVSSTEVYGDYADYLLHGTALPEEAASAELPSVTAESQGIAEHKLTLSGDLPTGIKLKGSSLLLDSRTTFRIYFTAKDLSGVTVTIDDEQVTPVQKDNYYYIQLENISAQDLEEQHTAVIGDSTLKFSALTYVYYALKQTENTKLVNTAKALYAYNQAANTYFDAYAW